MQIEGRGEVREEGGRKETKTGQEFGVKADLLSAGSRQIPLGYPN